MDADAAPAIPRRYRPGTPIRQSCQGRQARADPGERHSLKGIIVKIKHGAMALRLAATLVAAAALTAASVSTASAGTTPAARPPGSHWAAHIHLYKTPRPVTFPGRHGVRVRVPGSPQQGYAYEIININSGKCMEVYQSEITNYAPVDQYTCNSSQTQYWTAYTVGTLYGQPVDYFKNFHSSLCLDVFHSGTTDGTAVDQYSCNGTGAQLFVVYPASNGNSVLYNLNSINGNNEVVEVYHSSMADYGKVDTWGANGTLTQEWYL